MAWKLGDAITNDGNPVTRPPGDRELWVELARGIASFSVVYLHVISDWFNRFGKISPYQWAFASATHSLCEFAVPLFFMISGYLLLPRAESRAFFPKKRVLRVLVPGLAWSLVYLGLFGNVRAGNVLRETLDALINAKCMYHLWYLYVLGWFYLFLPPLAWCLETEARKRGAYLVGLWLISCAVFQWNQSHLGPPFPFSPPPTFTYLGFFVAGSLLDGGVVTKTRRRFCLSGFVYGWVATTAITSLASLRAGRTVETHSSYTSLGVILMSLSVFLLLREWGESLNGESAFATWLRRIGGASFGIYLSHVLVIKLSGLVFPWLYRQSVFVAVPISLSVFLIAFGLTEGLRKIPVFRRLV